MDDELRRLERAARLPGATVQDAACLLAAHLRRGLVAAERVELAAELGDPAAAAVLGRRVEPLDAWSAAILPAIARRVLAADESPPPRPVEFLPERPPHTNARDRFRPSRRALSRITSRPFWRVRAELGESEVIELVGARRDAFDGLGALWFDAILRRRIWPIESDTLDGATAEASAISVLDAVDVFRHTTSGWQTPLSAAVRQLDLGPNVLVGEIVALDEVTIAFQNCPRWDRDTVLVEAPWGYLARAWETWA